MPVIPVSPELAAAIEAPDRTPLVRVSLDWDGDGHGPPGSLDDLTADVAEVTVDRALVGDLPAQVRTVEGSAAAAADVDLAHIDRADERHHAGWYYSRHNAVSPIAGRKRLGQPVRVDVGFPTTTGGVGWVRRFTGRSRSWQITAARGTARLSALDGRERMRTPVQLPPVDGRPRQGLSATWVMSYALERAGVPVSPPPRPSCRWWSPMHGSGQAMIRGVSDFAQPYLNAWVYDTAAGTFDHVPVTFIDGPFNLAAHAKVFSTTRTQQVSGNLALAPGRSLMAQDGRHGRLELWVKGDLAPAPPAPPPDLLQLALTPQGGAKLEAAVDKDRRLVLRVEFGTTQAPTSWTLTGPVLPADGAWHAVGWAWDLSLPTVTGVVQLNGRETRGTIQPRQITLPPREEWGLPVSLLSNLPIAEIHLDPVPATTAWLANTGFTPAAVLDRSSLELRALLEPEPVEAWQLVTEIAATEHATAGFDEHGTFRYRTRPGGATVVRALTSEQAITDLAIEERIDAVRNVIRVGHLDIHLFDMGGIKRIWSTHEVYEIRAGQTVDIHAAFPPILNLDQPFVLNPSFPPPFEERSWIIPNTNPNGTGPAPPFDTVTVDVASWTAGSAHLRVTNAHTATVWLANNTGRANVQLGAERPPVLDGHVELADPASINQYGQQPLTIRPSRWVQDRAIAEALARRLLADLAQPQPVLTDLQVIGDPRLQLGDRVRIVDRHGTAIDADYWITGITDRIDASGYRQRITARQAT